jgi:hypothetical protein
LQNIRKAEAVALQVWRKGVACICPHKNTAFFGGAADDSIWLEGDLEIIRRCDALVCVEGWQTSKGSLNEIAAAKRDGVPVFECIEDFKQMAGIRGPGEPWYRRLLKSTTTYDIIGPVLGVGVGAASAVKFFKDGDVWIGAGVVLLVLLICMNAIVKAFVLHFQKEREKSPHDLESSLHALQSIVLVGLADGEPDPNVRVTIHVPRSADKLEQVLDYVGNQRRTGTAGRLFPAHCGIIGKAFRTKKACIGSRKTTDQEAYVKELVDEWGTNRNVLEHKVAVGR